MKIQEVLNKTTEFFRDKGIETSRLDAEILLAHSLGVERIDLYLRFDQPLQEHELANCRAIVRRRSEGEPVAYITGKKDFYGYTFAVNSSVLIPRPETELLVDRAVAWAKSFKGQSKEFRILDLGTGTGCVGISILKSIPNSKAILIDSSSDALDVAKQNVKSLGLSERVIPLHASVHEKPWGAEEFDIIVANPPYIAKEDVRTHVDVIKYEPHEALFAAENGFAEIRSWSSTIKDNLSRPSFVGFEIGQGQSKQALAHFESLGVFDKVSCIQDLAGIDRHIIASTTAKGA